jgi:hypothetical protein
MLNTPIHILFEFVLVHGWDELIILIGSQIIFNIEKLIKIICESIRIVHLSKCIGTSSNKMYTEEFTLLNMYNSTFYLVIILFYLFILFICLFWSIVLTFWLKLFDESWNIILYK